MFPFLLKYLSQKWDGFIKEENYFVVKHKIQKCWSNVWTLHCLKCPENGLRWSLTAPTGSTGLWWYKVERSEIRTRENWRTIGVGQHLQPKLKYLWYLKCQGCHYISHGIWYYMIFNIWNHMTWHDMKSHDITWHHMTTRSGHSLQLKLTHFNFMHWDCHKRRANWDIAGWWA